MNLSPTGKWRHNFYYKKFAGYDSCGIIIKATQHNYRITALCGVALIVDLYHLEKIEFQIVRFGNVQQYRVVGGLLSGLNKL